MRKIELNVTRLDLVHFAANFSFCGVGTYTIERICLSVSFGLPIRIF